MLCATYYRIPKTVLALATWLNWLIPIATITAAHGLADDFAFNGVIFFSPLFLFSLPYAWKCTTGFGLVASADICPCFGRLLLLAPRVN